MILNRARIFIEQGGSIKLGPHDTLERVSLIYDETAAQGQQTRTVEWDTGALGQPSSRFAAQKPEQ
jgi:hypothetical protein